MCVCAECVQAFLLKRGQPFYGLNINTLCLEDEMERWMEDWGQTRGSHWTQGADLNKRDRKQIHDLLHHKVHNTIWVSKRNYFCSIVHQSPGLFFHFDILWLIFVLRFHCLYYFMWSTWLLCFDNGDKSKNNSDNDSWIHRPVHCRLKVFNWTWTYLLWDFTCTTCSKYFFITTAFFSSSVFLIHSMFCYKYTDNTVRPKVLTWCLLAKAFRSLIWP